MDTYLINLIDLIDSKLKKHEEFDEIEYKNIRKDFVFEENKKELLDLLIKYYKFTEEIQ